MTKFRIASSFSFCFLMASLCGSSLWAASCCGGGFSAPTLISGDDRTQLTTSVSTSEVDTDVVKGGIWYKRKFKDETQVYKVDMSTIISDQTQIGLSVPYVLKNREDQSGDGVNSGLGDISGIVGYEFLPDWNYNPYRPKGLGFVSLTLPTGKSIQESQTGLDGRGRGYLAVGIGVLLTKNWIKWDAQLLSEIHQSFSKVTTTSEGAVNLIPGRGASASLSFGYNYQEYRLGIGSAWFQEDEVELQSLGVSQFSEAQSYTTASLSLSRSFESLWSATLTYSDQTILGDPSNTTLSKSLLFSLQKRWAR